MRVARNVPVGVPADPNLVVAAGRDFNLRCAVQLCTRRPLTKLHARCRVWDRRSLECVRKLPTEHKVGIARGLGKLQVELLRAGG